MEVITELSRIGYVLKEGHPFPNDIVDDIKKELTVAALENGYNIPKRFCLYHETRKGDLVLPRYYGISKLGDPVVNGFKRRTNVNFVEIKFNGKLRENQVEPAKAILNALANKGGGILSLQTGGGKTALAIFCISKLKARTIIIVNRLELVKQWKRELANFLPLAHVGEIRGDINTSENAHVVIGMINTISMKTFSPDAFLNYDLLVIDECHCMASEVFSAAMPKIRTPFTIGLSATPYRKDGLMKVVEYFMGEIVYKSESSINQIKDVNVKIIKYKAPRIYATEILLNNGNPNLALMLNRMAENPYRTQLIYEELVQLVKEPLRHILVLSDRKSLLRELHVKLSEKGISCGLFIGEMKDEEYIESKGKQIILGSYQICGTGFNLPSLNTLLMATPRGDITQIVGRILRKEHEINPLIVDIVDNFSTFMYMARKRLRFYNNQREIKLV